MEKWNPPLGRWRREIEKSQTPDLTDAWRQLTGLDDPDAVASLEKMLYDSKPIVQQKIVSVLGNIQGQEATDTLVRLAVNHHDSEIRQSAATTLGDRSWYGFVPTLLDGLATPIEFHYTLHSLGTDVSSNVSYSSEGSAAITNVSKFSSAQVPLNVTRSAAERLTRNAIAANVGVRFLDGGNG